MTDIETISEAAYANFCKVMKFDVCKWNSVFEFVLLTNSPRLMDGGLPSDKWPASVVITFKAYGGPHSTTLLQAYKIRRYSFRGRITAAPKKVVIIAAFFVYSLKNLMETWGGL